MQRPVPLSLSPLQSSALFLPFHNRTRIYVGARTALILTLILALIYPWSGYAFACIKPYTMRLYQHGRGAVSRSLYEYNTRVSRACGYTGWARNISKHLCFDTVQTFGIWIPSSNLFVRYLGKIVGLLVKKSVCRLNICVLWYMLRGMENLISILLKVFRIIKIKNWLGLYDYRKWGFLKNNISI